MSAPTMSSVLAGLRRPMVVVGLVPPLLTRLVLGHAFYEAGFGKLTEPENTTVLFGALGLPWPALSAALVGRMETVGGLALAMGLLCRPVATLLAVILFVALLTADRQRIVEALSAGATFGVTDIPSFVFLLLLSWLVAHGPGPLSVDQLALWSARRLRARRAARSEDESGSRPAASTATVEKLAPPPPGSSNATQPPITGAPAVEPRSGSHRKARRRR